MGHTQGIGSLVAKPAKGMQIFFNGGGCADRNWRRRQFSPPPPKLFLTSVMAVLKIKKLSELGGISF